jgi:hypothetical protein
VDEADSEVLAGDLAAGTGERQADGGAGGRVLHGIRDANVGGGEMTNGQIAQLRELSKCWNFGYREWNWIDACLWDATLSPPGDPLSKLEKSILRRLWHQYRNQIAAMRKNRQA